MVFVKVLLVVVCIHLCLGQECGTGRREGASCGTEKWRQDSFCFHARCIHSIERPFKLKVVIVYPEDSLSTEERQQGMLVVGEGLELSWQKKKKLRKGPRNQWFLTLSYVGGGKAVLCQVPSQCETTQRHLEFRVFLGNKDMLGSNFRVDLPVSRSLMPKNDIEIPQVSFYPWFNGRDCTVIRPKSYQLEGIGARTISLLLPPSFYENKFKRYKTLIAYGHSTVLSMKTVIADATVRRGLMEEIVVVGLEVKDSVGDVIPTHAPVLKCKHRPLKRGDRTCDYCIKCLSDEFTEPCDKFEFLREINKCASKWTVPGQGYHYLGSVLDVVLPQLSTKYRTNTNRKSLGIMGYGLAGMMACHAALKLSNRFSTAICMSSRFSWPDLDPNRRDFFDLLETNLKNVETMRLYIDANENDDWQFTTAAVSDVAKEAVQLLQDKYQLTLNRELFYFPLTYNGQGKIDTLKPRIVVARLWVPLTTMYKSVGNAVASQSSCSSTLIKQSAAALVAAGDKVGSGRPGFYGQASHLVDNPEGDSCKDRVSIFAMIGSILGTFVGTLVLTIIVMYMCRSPTASKTKIPEVDSLIQ